MRTANALGLHSAWNDDTENYVRARVVSFCFHSMLAFIRLDT